MKVKKEKSKAFISFCKKHDIDPDRVPEVMSFQAACKLRKINPKKLPVVKHLPVEHRKRIIADYKLTIIAEALRNNSRVDYNDTNQAKWYALFRVKASTKRKSGFGLSYDGYGGWSTVSVVGVRLCFHDWNIAKFFGIRFLALHKDHHLYT